MSLGEKLSPILEEIEAALWDHEAQNSTPPGFTDEGYRAVVKIFMSSTLERMWRLQGREGMTMEDREAMAQELGEKTRELIKTFTDIDTRKLYER